MTTKWAPTTEDRHTTGALMPTVPDAITPTFRWRDRTGRYHQIENMETRHLFFTLRMIWNNRMPAAFRLPGNLYSFGAHYSKRYLLDAIKAITPELAKRKDLHPDWQRQLNQMIDWLASPQLASAGEELLR